MSTFKQNFGKQAQKCMWGKLTVAFGAQKHSLLVLNFCIFFYKQEQADMRLYQQSGIGVMQGKISLVVKPLDY